MEQAQCYHALLLGVCTFFFNTALFCLFDFYNVFFYALLMSE